MVAHIIANEHKDSLMADLVVQSSSHNPYRCFFSNPLLGFPGQHHVLQHASLPTAATDSPILLATHNKQVRRKWDDDYLEDGTSGSEHGTKRLSLLFDVCFPL